MFKKNQSALKVIITLIIPVFLVKLILNYLPLIPWIEDVIFIGTATWAVYTLVKFLKK